MRRRHPSLRVTTAISTTQVIRATESRGYDVQSQSYPLPIRKTQESRDKRQNTEQVFNQLQPACSRALRKKLAHLPARFPLLELHGVHGDVPADQHHGGARGAENGGAALGLRRETKERRVSFCCLVFFTLARIQEKSQGHRDGRLGPPPAFPWSRTNKFNVF